VFTKDENFWSISGTKTAIKKKLGRFVFKVTSKLMGIGEIEGKSSLEGY
jgi:hypothetical protein